MTNTLTNKEWLDAKEALNSAKKRKKTNLFLNYSERDLIQQATVFLPTKSNLYQRIFHVDNNLLEIPLCLGCNALPAKWDLSYNREYSKFCSNSCSIKHYNKLLSCEDKKKRVQKSVDTKRQKYGPNFETMYSDEQKSKKKKIMAEYYSKNKKMHAHQSIIGALKSENIYFDLDDSEEN